MARCRTAADGGGKPESPFAVLANLKDKRVRAQCQRAVRGGFRPPSSRENVVVSRRNRLWSSVFGGSRLDQSAEPLRPGTGATSIGGRERVMARPRTISLDAMGGDRGPAVVVPGAAIALERHPERALPAFRRPSAHQPHLQAHPGAQRAVPHRPHRHGRGDAGQAEPGGAPRARHPACGWRSRPCRRARPTSWSRPATPAP